VKRYNSLLLNILERKRRSNSRTEKRFLRAVLDPVPGMQRDGFGNRWLRIGESETMIACHTDTVHITGGLQKLAAWRGELMLLENDGDCLGADDGAGVYAALRMIAEQVPALYVFHRQEEIGGHGSEWIASSEPELTKGIKRCISLDRRGTQDIITHQFAGRCASDEFADALAQLLDMGHSASDRGSFTDSANYTDLIPECTNLSIGYEMEHSLMETLDVDYLENLIARLCGADLESLPTVRDPSECASWPRHDTSFVPFYQREFAWKNGAELYNREMTPADKVLLDYEGK